MWLYHSPLLFYVLLCLDRQNADLCPIWLNAIQNLLNNLAWLVSLRRIVLLDHYWVASSLGSGSTRRVTYSTICREGVGGLLAWRKKWSMLDATRGQKKFNQEIIGRRFTFSFLESVIAWSTNLLFIKVVSDRATLFWLLVLYGEVDFSLLFGSLGPLVVGLGVLTPFPSLSRVGGGGGAFFFGARGSFSVIEGQPVSLLPRLVWGYLLPYSQERVPHFNRDEHG